jgi:hypothetical protein
MMHTQAALRLPVAPRRFERVSPDAAQRQWIVSLGVLGGLAIGTATVAISAILG